MKVLVVSYAGGHLKNLCPVVQSLRKLGAQVCFLVAPMAERSLKKINIEYSSFSDFASSHDRKIGCDIVDKIHNPAMKIEYASSLAYSGINFNDLIELCGLKRANILFDNFGVRAFFPYNFMLRIMDDLKPDFVVVTHTSARAEKAALYAAKEKKITVLAIEDLLGASLTFSPFIDLAPCDNSHIKLLKSKGILDANIITLNDRDDLQYIATTPLMGLGDSILQGKSKYLADYVIAGFSVACKNLRKIGYNENQIKIFGVPAFDSLYQSVKERKEWMTYNKGRKKNKILVTSQAPYTKDHLDFLKCIIKVALRFPEIDVLIKPHPSSGGNIEKELVNKYSMKNISIVDGDFQDFLPVIDCLITEYSTTGLEAIVYGVKVIIYQKSENSAVPYQQLDCIPIVKNCVQLIIAMEAVLSDKTYFSINKDVSKIIHNYIPPADRIAKLMFDIYRKNNLVSYK